MPLNKDETKKLLEVLMGFPPFQSPHGPLVPLSAVLNVVQPHCSDFTVIVQKGEVAVQLPKDPEPAKPQAPAAEPEPAIPSKA